MSDQDTLRIARQLWDAWNAHDVWETDTLPAPVVGHDGYRRAMHLYLTAFPDLPTLFGRPATP
jgi:hypothetical protein